MNEPMTRRLPFLAGCLLLLTAVPLLADEAEDKAVERVKELGGMVTRDEKSACRSCCRSICSCRRRSSRV